jgi:Na+/H+-dicarboxylate symporter
MYIIRYLSPQRLGLVAHCATTWAKNGPPTPRPISPIRRASGGRVKVRLANRRNPHGSVLEMGAPRLPLFLQILLAMVLGATVGLALDENAAPLGILGTTIVGLIKAIAAPLLFFAILDAFIKTEINARQAGRLLIINGVNAALALGIGLTLSRTFEPGKTLRLPSSLPEEHTQKSLDVIEVLRGYIPHNLVRPFTEDALIPIIFIAVLFGLSLRKVIRARSERGESAGATAELVETAYASVQVVIGWIVKLVPLAVFSAVAKVVGEHGFAPVRGLGVYLLTALGGISLQVLVVYQAWIWLVAKMPLANFWRGARDAIVYALGASSSLATLPVTLRSLKQLGVSDESSTLAACVGTNLNNDSILLYEAMAALFVAQAYGIELGWGAQLAIVACSALAGVGIAGVPDAGLISLSLVLTTVGLPIEILPLLLSVDWILSRARAASNVTADFVSAIVLDRWQKGASEPASTKKSESAAPKPSQRATEDAAS